MLGGLMSSLKRPAEAEDHEFVMAFSFKVNLI